MKILGIDPGTRQLGYGMIEDRRPDLHLLVSGTIRSNPRKPLPQRLLEIGLQLEQVLAEAKPDVLAIEQAFYGRNVASLISMGEGRGVALYAAARLGIQIHEYAPAEIKKAVTGRGAARKEQVAVMVRRLLGVEQIEGGLDASDALAAAICHMQRQHLLDVSQGQIDSLARRMSARRVRRGRSR